MTLLDRLDRRFGRYGVPHITIYVIFCQVFVYLVANTNEKIQLLNNIALVPNAVLAGEVWRLVSFLATPPTANPVFAFFFGSPPISGE